MKKLLILLSAFVLLARADMTKQTYSKTKLMVGMVSTEVTAQTDLRANMKADDQTMKVTAIIQGKPQHSTAITRLDKALIWKVNHENKTYTESPLRLPDQNTDVGLKGETKGSADTTQEYRIIKSEFTVKKLDSTKAINGFTCTGYIANWTLVIERIKTKEQTTSIMTLNEWTTPLTDVIKQAEAEEEAYNKAYMAKLGLTIPAVVEKNAMMGSQYLATIGIGEKQMAEKMKGFGAEMAKIEGYPIITEVKWEAMGDTTQPKAEKKEEKKSGLSLRGGLPSLGSISNMVSDKIGDKVAEKIEDQIAGNKNLVFSSWFEIKSISVSATVDNTYEVPEGYKKI